MMRGLLSTFSVSVIFYLFFFIPFLFLTRFSLCPVIGLEISRHSFNQSNAKLKQLRQTSFLFFLGASRNRKLSFFTVRSHWLFMTLTFFWLYVLQHNLILLNQRKVIVSGNIVFTPNCGDAVGKPKYRKRGKTQTRYRVAFKTKLWLYARQSNRISTEKLFKPLGVSDVI